MSESESERTLLRQGPKQGRRPSAAEMRARIGVLETELAAAHKREAAMAELLRARTHELEESLEYQIATSDVLKVISRSTFDLQPVLDTLVETASRLCGADDAAISVRQGEVYRFVSAFALDAEYWAILRQRTIVPGRESIAGRVALEGRVVHVADIRADPDFAVPETVAAGIRTILGVPLLREGAVIGTIGLNRKRVEPFSERHIELVRTFADQAVIAIENTRLLTELRDSLEQLTATAEVLQVINSSPGDLAPVFEAMVHKAIRLCDAASGTLWTCSGKRFNPVAVSGASRLTEWFRQHDPTRAAPDTPGGRLLGGERVVHIVDVRRDPAYRAHPRYREMADIENCRTFIAVGLRKEDTLLGMITVYRQEVRPFSDKQIALLQNFAAQAVIAMENARLLTETREALEQQTATAEGLQVINSSPGDLAPVFEAMLEKAARICQADSGFVFRLQDGLNCMVAAFGVPAEYKEFQTRNPIPLGRGNLAGRTALERRAVHIKDAAADPEYTRAEAIQLGLQRTMLGVPLIREDALIGVITFGRSRVEPFTERQIELVRTFADQAVIAIENARLLTETREALEQQTATAEVLQVINSSPGNLAPVFDAILEKAHKLCGASSGALIEIEGDRHRAMAVHGTPEFAEYWLGLGWTRFVTDAAARLRRGKIVHIDDYASLRSERNQRLIELAGAGSLLLVPLLKDELLLGAITAFRTEVRPFSDREVALLQNFAAQAVIAMENARLIGELRERTDQVAELNRGLEARVAEQVEELGRVGRLKRFLAPQLAELIVSHGDEKILESHRREIVVVFCDLRGYTAFTETAEPEEVLDFLREYHGALGPLVSQFEGTLDQFSGDGIMVFFNDPVPIPDPAERAVKMAVAMREAAGELIAAWRERGRDLGFGAGIAQGYATLGQIGFSERSGYTAIGTVCNVAARLCAEAKDGQILLSQRVNAALKGSLATEQVGALALKGLAQPVIAYNVPLVGSQAAFRVITGGAPSA